MKEYDVIVIGGGAAGLMSAIVAGQRGRRVIVLEGSNKIGKKILMSGGGRCNFTNLHCEPSRFISANSRFCVSALKRYTQSDFIALVERHSIPYHEKTAGQLFCDGSSKEIVAMLRNECQQAGVEIRTHIAIERVKKEKKYRVLSDKDTFAAESLVIASGGLSIPKMGASDFGYRLARQFGHKIIDTRAGLVPFTITGALKELTAPLSGLSLPVKLSTDNMAFREKMLFTHRGISGPAALQLSSYWDPGTEISVDLLPEYDATNILLGAKQNQPQARLRSVLSQQMPRALVVALQAVQWPAVAETPLAEISDKILKKLAATLQKWTIVPAGTEGYRTAEVTLGGVDTSELSSRTMESRRHPGLYFIGEVVDVTGHLGGYNFQWAWSSGHAAGEVV
ncbi:MAG: NAD(P)/FAD-dependent oxidoreductase [Gammaproteobacteria bacterium]|nr:NAD(P)/FAD-dependent oxidoreductase [Gammaproteobacteria bacterium]